MSTSYFHQERRRDVLLLLWCILLLSFQQQVLSFLPSSRRLFHPSIRGNCLRLHATVKAPAGGDKIRVRLLTDVKGTGRKGEIIVVSAAQYTNVLSPKKLAERVSDDKMNEILEKKKAESNAELSNAIALQEKIQQLGMITIARKVGPNDQLFGAVTNKQLMEIVKEKYGEHFTSTAQFSITSVSGCDEKGGNCSVAIDDNHLRKTGTYCALIKLHAKVEAKLLFNVIPE